MVCNKKNPPVCIEDVESSGLGISIGVDKIYVTDRGVVVADFDDVEWGYGSSGMLFVNHRPISKHPVPARNKIW